MYSTVHDLATLIPLPTLTQLVDDEGEKILLAAWSDGATRDSLRDTQRRVWDAITRADEVIDSYLRGRYPTPLSPVPSLIRSISAKLAVAEINDRRKSEPTKVSALWRDEAMNLLRLLQEGKATLDVDSPTGKEQPNEIRVNTRTRRFPSSLLCRRP